MNEEERSIEGVLSTETPVVVFDWARFEPVLEVLLMDGVELPERVPLLDSHSRYSTADIIGTTRNFRREVDMEGNPIIVATNYFSSVEENAFVKAKEGHLTDTSIGYMIDPEHTVKVKRGDSKIVNGRMWKNDYDMDMVIRKKWKLFENSLVPIGADQRAKLRSELPPVQEQIKINESKVVARSIQMNRNINKQ